MNKHEKEFRRLAALYKEVNKFKYLMLAIFFGVLEGGFLAWVILIK